MPPAGSGGNPGHRALDDGPPAPEQDRSHLRPAVFLDRDGTLIEERSYPTTAEDIVPLPGTGQALQRLASLGFLRIVLTNQSAVARGMLTEEGLAELHRHLVRQLNALGGGVDAIYYCPHHPDGVAVGYDHVCSCRKPAHGLLDMAVQEHSIDLSRSIFIGDCLRDLFVDAGPAAGRLLVRTGHPIEDTTGADAVLPSLVEATEWILERYGRRAISIMKVEAPPAVLQPTMEPDPEAMPPTAPPNAPDPGTDTDDEPNSPQEPAADNSVTPPADDEAPPAPVSGDVPHESGTDEPGSPHGQA